MQTLEINKEIIMEKDSLILGLSVRETVCAILGVGVIAGGYLFLQNSGLGLQGGSWLAIVAGIPFFAVGFYKKNGMPLEKYLAAIFRSKFLLPQKRPVSFPNTHYDLLIKERRVGGNEDGETDASEER